jgi:hypothetical protein
MLRLSFDAKAFYRIAKPKLQLDHPTTSSTHHNGRYHRCPLRSTPIALAMFLQRSAVAAARRVVPRAIAARTFTTTFVRRTSPRRLWTNCH